MYICHVATTRNIYYYIITATITTVTIATIITTAAAATLSLLFSMTLRAFLLYHIYIVVK